MVGYVPPPQGSGRQKDREAGDEAAAKEGWLGEAHRVGSLALSTIEFSPQTHPCQAEYSEDSGSQSGRFAGDHENEAELVVGFQ